MIPIHDDETRAQCACSIGPVQPDEDLVRAQVEPDHVVDGVLQETAVPLDDLSKRERGYSVERRKYTSRQRCQSVADGWVAKKPEIRAEAGFSVFRCVDVRSISLDGKQALRVYDSPVNDHDGRGHASIYADGAISGRSKLRKLRNELLKLMLPLCSLDDVFGQ